MKKAKKMICPYCGKLARWCDNAEIYGRSYGKSYMCYWCQDCDARVGCHNNTKHPLGTMANKELREWRQRAHGVLDPLWQYGTESRSKVYAMLSEHFGKVVHIGESDIETCRKIIEYLKK